MPILINPATNKPFNVAEKDISTALQEGLVFKPGSKVLVVDTEGSLLSAPAEEAPSLFAAGARLSTPEDRANAVANEQDTMKREVAADSPWTAAGMSALSGATFGVSDVIGKAVGGEEYSENRKLLAEENPVANVVGGVAGSLAAMPVSIAGLGARATIGASKALAPTILAKAANLPFIGKPLAATAKAGLDAATQGAIYGTGTGISEAALGKPEDRAENFMRGVGYGALFGAAGGAGVSAAGQIIGRVAGGVAKGTGLALKAGVEKAATLSLTPEEKAIYLSMSKSEKLPALLEGTVAKDINAASKAAALEVKVLKNEIKNNIMESKDPEGIKQSVLKIKDDIEASRKNISDMYGEGFASIDEHLAPTGQSKDLFDKMQVMKEKYAKNGHPEIANALDNTWTRSGGEAAIQNAKGEVTLLHKLRQELQTPGSEFKKVTQRNFDKADYDAIVGGVGTATKNYGAGKAEYEGIRDTFQMLDPMYGSTKELQKVVNKLFMRKSASGEPALDYTKIENFTQKSGGKSQGMREDFAKAYEKFLDVPTVGKGTTDQIDTLLQRYGDLIKAKQVDKDKIKELDAIMSGPGTRLDKVIQISDMLGTTAKGDKLKELLPQVQQIELLKKMSKSSSRAEMLPSAIGMGLHSAGVPAVVSYGLTGGVLAAFNPHRALQTINSLNKVSNAAYAKGVGLMDRFTANIARRPQAIMAAQKGRSPENWEEQKKQFEPFKDPASVVSHVEDLTQSLNDHPEMKRAIQDQMIKGLTHLSETFPQPLVSNTDRIMPTKSEPSKVAQQAWLRRKAVLENPEFFIERMANGEVPTKEEVETLHAVFPQYSNSLREAVTKGIAESKDTIPVTKRLQLARLLGVPSLDKQTDPDYNQAMQNTLYPVEKPKPQKGGGVGSGNLGNTAANMTEMDRVISRS